MTDLILYIVKQLVTNPDAVSVEEHSENGEVNLLLTVDPADMGLIIGKNGQTIKAIRKVLIVKAMADNVRVNLQLNEPAGGRPERSADQQVSESAEPVDQQTSESKNTDTPASADQADTPTPADTVETPAKAVATAKKTKKAKKEPEAAEPEEPAPSDLSDSSELSAPTNTAEETPVDIEKPEETPENDKETTP